MWRGHKVHAQSSHGNHGVSKACKLPSTHSMSCTWCMHWNLSPPTTTAIVPTTIWSFAATVECNTLANTDRPHHYHSSPSPPIIIVLIGLPLYIILLCYLHQWRMNWPNGPHLLFPFSILGLSEDIRDELDWDALVEIGYKRWMEDDVWLCLCIH